MLLLVGQKQSHKVAMHTSVIVNISNATLYMVLIRFYYLALEPSSKPYNNEGSELNFSNYMRKPLNEN